MSQQHKKWSALVEQRLKEKGWTRVDLALAVGLRSSGTITDLITKGKGSIELKVKVSKVLNIREPWELFEGE
ncbi:transcriptional regulator [Streptococcus uberis]|nr:transcriptional regulator [Streptococcus uberis]